MLESSKIHDYTVKPVSSGHSKIDKKVLQADGRLCRSNVLQNAPPGAFCNTFDLHLTMVGLVNQFSVRLRVAVLSRFYCILCTLHLPSQTEKKYGWGNKVACTPSENSFSRGLTIPHLDLSHFALCIMGS